MLKSNYKGLIMKHLLLLLFLFGANTSLAGIETPSYEKIKIKFTGNNIYRQQGQHYQLWVKKRGLMVPIIRLNVDNDGHFYRASKNGGALIEKYDDTYSVSSAELVKGHLENYLYNAQLFVTLEPDNDFNLGGEFDVSTVIMKGQLKGAIDGYDSPRYVAETVWSPVMEKFKNSEFHLILN